MTTLSTKPTILIFLDTRRALKKKGKLFSNGAISETIYPLKLRATFQVIVEGTKKWIQALYPLGQYCSERDYKAAKSARVRTLRQGELKEAIIAAEQKAATICRSHEVITIEDFTNLFCSSGSLHTVEGMYKIKGEELVKAKAPKNTRDYYSDGMTAVSRYAPGVRFAEVTVEWLEKFEAHLSATCNATTIGMIMISLRTIYNMAKKKKIASAESYPFGKGRYEIKTGEGRNYALDLEEKNRLEKYVTTDTAIREGVDMWLFSFYAYGLNMADIFEMKFFHIKTNAKGEREIVKKRKKTAGKKNRELVIPVTPAMQTIIDTYGNSSDNLNNYVFPLYDDFMHEDERQAVLHKKQADINAAFRIVGPALGYTEPVTCYTARHTFANVSRELGRPIEFISDALGHKTIAMTQNYLKGFSSKVKREHSNELVGAPEVAAAPLKVSKGKAKPKAKGKAKSKGKVKRAA